MSKSYKYDLWTLGHRITSGWTGWTVFSRSMSSYWNIIQLSDKSVAKDIKEISKRIPLVIPLRHQSNITHTYEIPNIAFDTIL